MAGELRLELRQRQKGPNVMFRPKKTIPKLAVAALTLSGCGNGGDAGMETMDPMDPGSGGPGNANFDAAVAAACMKFAGCYQEDAQYVEECENYYADCVSANDDDARCTAAIISYFDCLTPRSCAEIGLSDVCVAEYDAFVDDCPSPCVNSME